MVDVETTGNRLGLGDRVTEVAAVLVRGRTIEPVFESLVNPERPIASFVTQLTGITNAMVRRAPTFPEVAGALAEQLAGRVFVAHNAPFDWQSLTAEFERMGAGGLDSLATDRVCTVRLARRFLRHLRRHNLDALCAHYDVEIRRRHRAMGDAEGTARVLVALMRDAERAGIETFEEFVRAGRRAVRRRRSALPYWSDGV